MSPGMKISQRRWRALKAARRKVARWAHRPEVVSVGIGLRRRAGEACPEVCIVVTVDWKLAAPVLGQHRRRAFPRRLEVEVEGRRCLVGVDVQESRGQIAARLQGVVGAPVARGRKVIGAVSLIVEAGDARAALISGHVARERGRTLKVGGHNGVTRAPVRNEWLDHCVVDVPQLPPDAVTLVDGVALAGVRAPESLQLGEPLFFHRAETGKRIGVTLQELAVSAWVEISDEQTLLMRELLTTEAATVPGDSGALLYDAAFQAVGTLVGVLGDKSHFIPCKRALASLDLELAAKERS